MTVSPLTLPSGRRPAARRGRLRWGLSDVLVLTLPELVAKEQAFWQRVTPVGVVFDIGMVMGFIVGMAICYQVLFSEISDRLAEFATLKAAE